MKSNRVLLLGSAIAAALVVALVLWHWRPDSQLGQSHRAAVSTGDPELDPFQGSWEFVSMEVNGRKTADSDLDGLTVELTNHLWKVFEGPDHLLAQREFVLHPTGAFKQIDLLPGSSAKERRIRGIYKFEGDRLTVCDRSEENGERPTTFRTAPNSGLVLVVLRRLDE